MHVKREKSYFGILVWMLLSILIVFFTSARTSPLYPLMLGNYGGNDASDAMLIGKYWVSGSIPYKDLYAVGAPLYYLMQRVGWQLGERWGIAILEILNLGVFLSLTNHLSRRYIRQRYAAVLTLLAAGVVVALGSGGNSAVEWSLSVVAGAVCLLLADGNKQNAMFKRSFLLGVLLGISLFLNGNSAGILCLGIFCSFFHKEVPGMHMVLRRLGIILLGVAIIAIPTLCYFAANGSLALMCEATFTIPVRIWMDGFNVSVDLLHKIIKCMLLLPAISIGLYQFRNTERKDCRLLLWMACGNVIILLGGNNLWYRYLLTVPLGILGISMAAAYVQHRQIAVLSGAILTIAICTVPCKNYIRFLGQGVPDVIEEFAEDVEEFKRNYPNKELWMEDTDSSYYLALNLKPLHLYFSNQTVLAAYSKNIRDAILSYRKDAPDILLTTQRGWQDQGIDGFALAQVYMTDSGNNLCIYQYINE